MFTVPWNTPDTMPEVPTVAMAVPLLVQVPPGMPSVSGVVEPIHTCIMPVIGVGTEFTVTEVVARQPVAAMV